jgi:hypothetical protein
VKASILASMLVKSECLLQSFFRPWSMDLILAVGVPALFLGFSTSHLINIGPNALIIHTVG